MMKCAVVRRTNLDQRELSVATTRRARVHVRAFGDGDTPTTPSAAVAQLNLPR